MSNCTHISNPPCARCVAWDCKNLLQDEYWWDEATKLIDAHAAAAYQRGRREAFEEAAQICHNGADRRRVREYAAEEGSDG